VAVRADDIALRNLRQHPLEAAIDHPRYQAPLLRRIPVVKVHRALGEAAAAIRAWHRPELVEDIGVISPSIAVLVDARRRGRRPAREPLPMLATTPEPMAIRAHDVALRRLVDQLRAALEHRLSRTQGELLLCWISMVEVHLMWLKAAAAICARHVPQVTQKRRRRILATTHSTDFLLAIRGVVANIELPLIARFGHAQV
jgi:hypothetical protein